MTPSVEPVLGRARGLMRGLDVSERTTPVSMTIAFLVHFAGSLWVYTSAIWTVLPSRHSLNRMEFLASFCSVICGVYVFWLRLCQIGSDWILAVLSGVVGSALICIGGWIIHRGNQ